MNPLITPQPDAAAPLNQIAADFLSFSADGPIDGLLAAGQLVEVLAIPTESIVPISSTPEAVMGVCNWRGEVLWLIDFGVIVQTGRLCDRTLLQPQYDVVIAQSNQGPVGLVVTAIGQFRSIEPTDIQPTPPSTRLALPDYFQGYWQAPNGGQLGAILAIDRLLASLAELSARPSRN